MRVGEMVGEWLTHKRSQQASGELAAATIAAYEDAARHLESVASAKVSKLTRQSVETLLANMPGTYAPRVRSVLAQSADFAGIAPNPFRQVRTSVKLQRVTAVPSLETIYRLAELCREYEPLVLGLAASGMRFGEAIALPPDLVNGRQVTVMQSYCQRSRTVKETKTGNIRRVLVAEFGATAFKAQIHEHSRYVFSPKNPLNASRFHRDYWQPAKRALEVNWRIHDLRHFYATYTLSKGVPVATVAAWLGHSTAQTTMRVYAGYIEDDYSVWSEVV